MPFVLFITPPFAVDMIKLICLIRKRMSKFGEIFVLAWCHKENTIVKYFEVMTSSLNVKLYSCNQIIDWYWNPLSLRWWLCIFSNCCELDNDMNLVNFPFQYPFNNWPLIQHFCNNPLISTMVEMNFHINMVVCKFLQWYLLSIWLGVFFYPWLAFWKISRFEKTEHIRI